MVDGGQYIVRGVKKFQSRPANRKVVDNVVKDAVVPSEPIVPVALGLRKPKTTEECDKDVAGIEDGEQLEADYFKDEEAIVGEEPAYEQTPGIVPPEETPFQKTHKINIKPFNRNAEKYQRRN